jgi:uncharacterized protein YlxW (UPF0749 family)
MTDQQRPVPGPGDEQATPPVDDRAAARAAERTRPLRRPVTPAEEPAAGPPPAAPAGQRDEPAVVATAGRAAEIDDADPTVVTRGAETDPTVVAGRAETGGAADGETTRLTPPRPDEEPTARLQPLTPDVAPETGETPGLEETHRLTEAQIRAAGPAAGDVAAGPATGDVDAGPAARDDATAGATGDDATAPAAGDHDADPAADGDADTAAEPAAPAPAVGATVSPEAVTPDNGGDPVRVPEKAAPWQRLSSAGALIWVLLALFGFTLVVQLRSNDTDQGLAGARQDDLVRILSDLEARDTRLQAEITALEGSRQQLTSGVAGREAALAEADKRADELGLLAGTLPGRGSGLVITIAGVKASEILNAVQELRGAGGEVMQISGAGGRTVRIVASTYFVDAEGGGIVVDGERLAGPYTLTVIGVPQTMQTALEIPGGVVASVQSDGGSVTMEQRISVDVTAVREATSLQYARPVS